jgi:hypothetical protein
MMRFTPLNCVALIGVVLLPAIVRAEAEEEAVRVYRDVQGSVVGLKNAECSGTGIILDSKGTILTNAHVAVSPLPFECTVDVIDGGKKRQVTFKKVEVVGFDPRLDLALLRVDPAEQHVTLKPVVINPKKGDVGQKVYAIGNPLAGGQVMTKTITSGMLGAVDREIDGDRFYQIDAAINPGNSGGPICDRNGQVLGLVTFKFSDAQAIGFAIPLGELKTSAFIPLLQRKANPQLAEEIIKIARKFHDKANEVGAKKGRDSDDRKRYDAYAFAVYRSALVYDPSNPAIYSAIGDLLTSLGEADEISIAYFARFFRMNPWHGGGFYVNFGFSYGKLKQQPQQAIVWEEGLAKYPWYSVLWEDMAFNHAFNHDHAKAAWGFGMCLFLGVHKDRFELIKRHFKEHLDQLTPEERKDFDAKNNDKYKLEFLDRLTELSNAARKDRQIYMTKAFADLIGRVDGPPLPEARDRIPQKPAERPARFKNR